MKKYTILFVSIILLVTSAVSAQIKLKVLDNKAENEELLKHEKTMKELGFVKIEEKLPKPIFIGTKKEVKLKNLEPLKKRKAIFAPKNVQNIALNKLVTSSDSEPIIGSLDLVTDGDKEGFDGSFVELGPGKQWIQIDLGKKSEIFHVLVWHFHQEIRSYKGVVVQVSNDKDFIENVTTIYNNDNENINRLGSGKSYNYIETHEGYRVGPSEGKTVKGRFIRFYSNGNTSSDMNHYIEVEVYGIPLS